MSKRDRTGVTHPTDHTIPNGIIAELTVIDCDGCEAGEDMDGCLKCEQGQLRMLHLLAVEVEGLRAAGGFAGLPETKVSADSEFAAFDRIFESVGVSNNSFHVFKVGEAPEAVYDNIPNTFRGFIEGMTDAQKHVILGYHFGNPVVQFSSKS